MISFGDLLLSYILWLGNRPSASKYRQLYRQYFAASSLRDKPAHEVTRHEIILFKQTYERTPANCGKAMDLIRGAYNWGIDRIDPRTRMPLYEGSNPAWRVHNPGTTSRERVMDRSEVRIVLAGIEFLPLKHQAFIVGKLLIPSRIKELCEMRRDAVNLETGKWFKEKTKNGRPQWTLIPHQALAYLRRLPIQGDFFFMGVYGRPIQRESMRKAWGKLRRDLGMSDVWLLDFRRTLATYLYTEIHADDLTAKAVLNHYDGRPVAVYTRLNYDRLAAIIQQYADWIWQLMPKDETQTAFMFDMHHTPTKEREYPQFPIGGA